MTSIPLVSVVIAVHNGVGGIGRALESISNQSLEDIEIIVVDDGSEDETRNIVSGIAKSDRRIRLIVDDEKRGLTTRLIELCSLVKGKYIARLDAFTEAKPHRLSRQIDWFEGNDERVLVGTGYGLCSGKDIVAEYNPPVTDTQVRRMLDWTNVFLHGSAMFRRDAYEEVGGYRQQFKFAQDYDLWLRLSKIGEMGNLSGCLTMLRSNPNSTTMLSREEQVHFGSVAVCSKVFVLSKEEEENLIENQGKGTEDQDSIRAKKISKRYQLNRLIGGVPAVETSWRKKMSLYCQLIFIVPANISWKVLTKWFVA